MRRRLLDADHTRIVCGNSSVAANTHGAEIRAGNTQTMIVNHVLEEAFSMHAPESQATLLEELDAVGVYACGTSAAERQAVIQTTPILPAGHD